MYLPRDNNEKRTCNNKIFTIEKYKVNRMEPDQTASAGVA